MNKILKITFFCIIALAIGISLGNIADLKNNNTSLKTDNEILTEQLQDYADSLTLTKAELIVAQNDRDKLKQDIVTCENKIAKLNSQSIVDKEALASAENDLATTQQKLAEKESEIAKFNDTIEKYSIYPMISYYYNGEKLQNNIFRPSYDIYTRVSTYISDNDSNEWVRASTTNFYEKTFRVIVYNNSSSRVSFYSKFNEVRSIYEEMLNAGIQVGSLLVQGYLDGSSTYLSCFVHQPFYIADFLELTADGILSKEDVSSLNIDCLEGQFPGDLTNFMATRIYVYAHFLNNDLDISSFSFDIDNVSEQYYSESLIFNEEDFAPNKLFLGISDRSLYAFNKIQLNVQLDALVIAPIDHGQSYYDAFTSNDMITFSDDFYVERLYLPNDVKSSQLIDDLQGKYGEIIYLDFSLYVLITMSYPF